MKANLYPTTLAELSQLYVGVNYFRLAPRERAVVQFLIRQHNLLEVDIKGYIKD